MLKKIVCWGVVLGACAVQAEALVIEAGENVIYPVSVTTNTPVTIKGTLTMPAGAINRCSSVSMPGGSLFIEGGLLGYYENKAASYTLSQGEDGTYARIVATGGQVGSRDTMTLAKETQPIANLSEDGYLDYLTLRDGAGMAIAAIDNNTSVTGRLTIAGTGATFTSHGWNTAGRFRKGNHVLRLQDGAVFNFNMSNQRGNWNAEGVSIVTEGTGDIRLLHQQTAGSAYQLNVRSGAYFNHHGKLGMGRGGAGAYVAMINFTVSDVIGPNVTDLCTDKYGSVDPSTQMRIDDDVTLTVRSAHLAAGGSCSVFGAGTLKIGAADGTSGFTATSFDVDCTTVIEKVGANEMTLELKGTDKWMPTLKLTEGTVRFVANTTVGELVPNGGRFVIDAGKVVCFDAGLAAYEGEFTAADGGAFAAGEHLVCYYKGEAPQNATAKVALGYRAAVTSEEVTEGDYAGYTALKVTVEYLGRGLHFTESGDVDILAEMGGTMDVPCDVIVDEGVVVTNTTALVGSMPLSVTGGGTLVLNAASPDLTGEIYVGNAALRVLKDGSLGSGNGKVTVQGAVAAGGISQVVFDLGSERGTFANDFTFESSSERIITSKTSERVGGFRFVQPKALITFTGRIQTTGELALIENAAYKSETVERVRFEGPVSCTGQLYVYVRYRISFMGKVTAASVSAYGDAASPNNGTPRPYFGASGNEIGYLTYRINAQTIAGATDAFANTYVYLNDVRSSVNFDLGGFDQKVRFVYTQNDASNKGGVITSAESATLTLTGSSASDRNARYTTLTGKLGLTMDAAGDNAYHQTFKGGIHTMSGKLTVKNGTLSFTDGETRQTSLANVPEIEVSGGALNLTTATDGACAGVTNVVVSGGTFTVGGTGADLFGEAAKTQAVLNFSGNGQLSIAEGTTVPVRWLLVDGKFRSSGRYTGVGGPADAKVLPQLAGTGVLSVRSSGKGLQIILR